MTKGIQKIFTEATRTYEFVNHVLTFWLDIIWRRAAARVGASKGGSIWLDVCSGTGEMAAYLQRLAEPGTRVIAADFTLTMLQRVKEKPERRQIELTLGDAKRLPFPDATFDLITISFATRNINLTRAKLTHTLREFHRILKPGGVFVNLETSQPRFKVIRDLFHLYAREVVRWLGYIISGSKTGYAYLSHTVRRFYTPEDFAKIIFQAGFSEVGFKRMMLGISAIHKAVK
ncbi:MAG: ubiquinone/menaquinone biosynthesis methyltransferase [Candidatus Thorarchaeota archaeon]